MPKTYHISKEEAQEIRAEMKNTKNSRIYRRLEVVALRGEGMSNNQISEITKYHTKRVSQIVSAFANKGLNSFVLSGYKGGNHKNLSREEESKLLESFCEQAATGQIITIEAIKQKYDEAVGRETHKNHIYAVLKRNAWRKVMPRSKHPNKASDEVIAASKKLTFGWMN